MARPTARARLRPGCAAFSAACLAVVLLTGGCGGGSDGFAVDTAAAPDAGGVRDTAAEDGTRPVLEVRIASPLEGAVIPPGAEMALEAEVTWTGAEMWKLQGTWTSSAAGDLGQVRPDDDGRLMLTGVTLPGGPQTVSVRVVSEVYDTSAGDSVAVTVRRIPSAPTVHVEPAAPTTDAALAVVIDRDANVDPGVELSYDYRWLRDGAIAQGQTEPTIGAHLTTKGETWEAIVTPLGDGVEGTPGRASATVRNSPPAIASVRLLPSVATTDTTLRCEAVDPSDADADPVTYVRQWRVDGAIVDGEEGETLDGAHFARGDRVVCALQPFDGEDHGAIVSSDAVTIDNSVPWADAVSVTPGDGTASDTFRCVVGASGDHDDDPVTFRWTWYLDGEEQPGAVTQTFTPFGASRGQKLACGARPDDGYDTGSLVRSADVTLGNTPPVVDNVLVQPAAATALDTLTCVPQDGFDADGDDIGYSYAWYVNEEPVAGQDGATLPGGQGLFHRDDVVYCEATPNDGLVDGPAEQSKNSVRVGNAPPSLAAATIDPGSGDVNTAFTCLTDGWADPDPGDSEAVRYRWFVNDELVVGATDRVYDGPLAAYDELVCEATPFDGVDDGAAVRSEPVAIVDLPPSIDGVSLVPREANRTSTLECTPEGWHDPEGAPPDYRYAWQVNGAIVAAATGRTFDAMALERGYVVLCRATPWDGVQEGEPAWSNAVAIGNAPPSVGGAQLVPAFGNHNTVFRCEPLNPADLDDDTVFYGYAWFQNGERLEGRATETVTIRDYQPGDLLRCELTPTDGIAAGEPALSNEAMLFNLPPSVATVTVTPSPAVVTDTLTCAPEGVSDSDGDDATFRVEWLVNGAVVAGETDLELIPGPFAKHDQVVCRVTPNDGYQDGPARSSEPVPVLNSLPSIDRVTVQGEAIDLALWFRCDAHGVRDVDQDDITFRYRWFRNGVEMVGATGEMIPGDDFTFDENVQCAMRPYDQEQYGEWVHSAVLDVQNTPPEAEILRPDAATLQQNSWIEFEGRVWDIEDRPEDLAAWWTMHDLGAPADDPGLLLGESQPDTEGIVTFGTNELSEGAYLVRLHVRDSLLAEGQADVEFLVVSICGRTGHVAEEVGPTWADGFESGGLTRWDFSNRKYVSANGYQYIMSGCDNPHEFWVDPAAAEPEFGGELGLMIDLPESPPDVYSVAKSFGGQPMTGVRVECWVYAENRVNLQFGFYHYNDGTQDYSGGAVLRTSTSTATYLPPGPAASGSRSYTSLEPLPLRTWVPISIWRDLATGEFVYYEDGAEIIFQDGLDDRAPTGFSIGASSGGGANLMYVDRCSYFIVSD